MPKGPWCIAWAPRTGSGCRRPARLLRLTLPNICPPPPLHVYCDASSVVALKTAAAAQQRQIRRNTPVVLPKQPEPVLAVVVGRAHSRPRQLSINVRQLVCSDTLTFVYPPLLQRASTAPASMHDMMRSESIRHTHHRATQQTLFFVHSVL